jgi:hypothetical protein
MPQDSGMKLVRRDGDARRFEIAGARFFSTGAQLRSFAMKRSAIFSSLRKFPPVNLRKGSQFVTNGQRTSGIPIAF